MFGSMQFDIITTTEIDRYLSMHYARGDIMRQFVTARITEDRAVIGIQSSAHTYGIDIGIDAIRAYLDAAALSNRMRLYLVAHWALHTDVSPDAADVSDAATRNGCDVSYDDADTFLMSATSFVGYVTEKTGR